MGTWSNGLPKTRRPHDLFHPLGGAVLIVTGSNLRAEEMDRPLAYYIREKILERNDTDTDFAVCVLSDYRYLYEQGLAELPTISIGGPGVNALAQKWLEDLPIVLAIEDELFIQMDDGDNHPTRCSIWGIDHEATRIAVSAFVDHHLDAFLSRSHARI